MPPRPGPPEGPPPPGPPGTRAAGPPAGEDRSRSGAVWVTATGAFLVAVAAALFVAVRWDTIGDPAKLGILAALTGAALLAGERMHASLPATGRVVSHLGAFLAPLNVTAVTVHLLRAADRPVGLIATEATAVTAAVLWWALDRRRRSPLLATAAATAVVVAAGAAGALAGASGALLLAGAAVVASAVGARRTAVAWATVAGTAPVAGAAMAALDLDRAVELSGLGRGATGLVAMATGAVGALVLAREATRAARPEPVLLLAATSAAVGVLAGRADLDVAPATELVGWAGIVLALEVAALAWRTDAFWGRPLRVAAGVGEALAVPAFAVAALAAAIATTGFVGDPAPPAGPPALAVTALLVAAWSVADLRRAADQPDAAPSGWWAAAPLVAATAGAGVALGTHAAVPTAIVLVAAAAWALYPDRRLGGTTAAVATALAALLPASAAWSLPVGAVGGSVLALAAVRRGRGTGMLDQQSSWALACAAALPPITALAADTGRWTTAAQVASVVLLGAVAEVADRAGLVGDGPRRGLPARALATFVAGVAALAAVEGDASATLAVAVAGAALLVAVAGALRTHDPRLLALLAVSGPAVVVSGALASGYDLPLAGVAVAAAGVVAAGVRLLVAPAWARGMVPALVGAATVSLALTAGDPAALGVAVLAVGGTLLAESLVTRSVPLGTAGGAVATLGTWQLLAASEVDALDAWAAPVALALIAGGAIGRAAGRGGSWVAYGPGLALAGGTALVERAAGGHGGHALLVGAIGVAAVAVGGLRRLSAPLLVGTALLVALAVRESLTLTAAVPTWAWLAVGGGFLIGVGVWLERRDTGPFEAGQRVVQAVRDRYS